MRQESCAEAVGSSLVDISIAQLLMCRAGQDRCKQSLGSWAGRASRAVGEKRKLFFSGPEVVQVSRVSEFCNQHDSGGVSDSDSTAVAAHVGKRRHANLYQTDCQKSKFQNMQQNADPSGSRIRNLCGSSLLPLELTSVDHIAILPLPLSRTTSLTLHRLLRPHPQLPRQFLIRPRFTRLTETTPPQAHTIHH